MPNDLNGGSVSGSENNGLSKPQAKSPLEQSAEVKPAGTEQPQPSTMPEAPKPPEIKPMDEKPAEAQTTPAPDTDEFLKSILDDKSNPSVPPPPAETTPPKPEPMPSEPMNEPTPPPPTPPATAPMPIEDESALEKEVDREESTKFNPSNLETQPEVKPKIKDEITGMDGIIANQNAGVGQNQSTAPSEPQYGNGQTVSSGFPPSDQNEKPVSGKSSKWLYVLIVIVIVAIGGYTAYTMFGSKSSTPTVSTSPLASSTSTVSTLSADQRRKDDLYIIQQALLSYYTNNGNKYPVAPTIIFLNSPGNVLETALVPNYLGSLPADPDVTKNYGYKSADGTKFELTAVLDDQTDPEAQVKDGKAILTVTQDSKAPVSSSAATTTSSVTVTPLAQNTSLTSATF